MRLVLCLLLAVAMGTGAEAISITAFFETVRGAIRSARSDADVAALIAASKLGERLTAPVIEALESEGAGPASLRALENQEELTAALLTPVQQPRLFDAPAVPTAEEQKAIIEQARTNALNYTSSLPNFLCTQTVTRMEGKAGDWKAIDTLTIALTYTSRGERYRLEKVDSKPAGKTLAELGGYRSDGEFGSLLKSIFRQEAQTAFVWQRWTILNGHLTQVYSFHIEQNRSNYHVAWKSRFRKSDQYVALSGSVYLDSDTHAALRVVTDAEGIPPECPMRKIHGELDYGTIDIAGKSYTLPAKTENRIWMQSVQKRNISVFEKYRKFAGDSVISFDPPVQ